MSKPINILIYLFFHLYNINYFLLILNFHIQNNNAIFVSMCVQCASYLKIAKIPIHYFIIIILYYLRVRHKFSILSNSLLYEYFVMHLHDVSDKIKKNCLFFLAFRIGQFFFVFFLKCEKLSKLNLTNKIVKLKT